MKTDITLILDRSGSMGCREKDVVEGINSFIKGQKEVEGEARVSLILFDDHYDVVRDAVDVQEFQDISSKEYFVRGCTALLDSVGKAISLAKKDLQKAATSLTKFALSSLLMDMKTPLKKSPKKL